jgi:hypothetical protein
MKKYKHFINFSKEEKWLNDMAKQGYELVAKHSWGGDFQDYCTLFEDSGWRHLAGTKKSGTHYFALRTIGAHTEHEIFSDNVSKAGRYKRLSDMWISLFSAFIPIVVVLLLTDIVDIQSLLNPKLLYYTPGLWDKEGIDFWKAFLFETPIALMRGFLWLFTLLTCSLYLYFGLKAHVYYKRSLMKGNR